MKLSKKDRETRNKLRDALVLEGDKLNAAIALYDNIVAAAFEDLTVAVAAYQFARGKVVEFSEQIISDAVSEIDEKSERWHESDAASQAEAYVQAWQDVADKLNEDVELDEPQPLDGFSHEDDVQMLEEAPENSSEA
jgi:predicted ester cyclase